MHTDAARSRMHYHAHTQLEVGVVVLSPIEAGYCTAADACKEVLAQRALLNRFELISNAASDSGG